MNVSEPTCSVEGCEREPRTRGWCSAHYQTWRRRGDPLGVALRGVPAKCAGHGCERVGKVVRGFCSKHYSELQRRERGAAVRQTKPCSVDGCELRSRAREWCTKHLTRWYRYGDAEFRLPGELRNGCRICPLCKEDKALSEWGKGYCRLCVRRPHAGSPSVYPTTEGADHPYCLPVVRGHVR